MKNKNVVFFDFDKTIVNIDSFFDFLKFSSNKEIYLFIFYNFPILLTKLIGKNWRLNFKNKLWEYFYDLNKEEVQKYCNYYFEENIDKILHKNSIETLKLFSEKDFDIYIISATANILIESFRDILKKKYNINVIANGSEYYFDKNNETKINSLKNSENKINIKIKTNHYGKKKEEIINKIILNNDYTFSFAYGDSKGDKYMLKWCDKGYIGKDVMNKAIIDIKIF
jgi:phosphoserine phosphatase